jgi:Zn-dependent peptidase ImmA (M78 family)
MAPSTEALIKPELLVWARTSAGFDVAQIAKKLKIPTDRLQAWESGAKKLTVAQLRRLAEIYRRPLAVFYLPVSPKNFDAMHDFRRLPGEVSGIESPELRLEIRKALYRRGIAVDLANALDEKPPQLNVKAEVGEDPEIIGLRIRKLLSVSPQQQSDWKNENQALRSWRNAIEKLGILVFQARHVDIAEMFGFSITESPFPALVVNVKHSVRGRIFTMLHELAHIVLNQDAICDLDEETPRATEDLKIEVVCNHVAGAALIPKESLLQEEVVAADHKTKEWPDHTIDSLARDYWVSREVVVRRLLLLGLTTQSFYKQKREQYKEEYASLAGRKKKPGFAPPDRIAINAAGEQFVRLVLSSYANEKITASDVADYLDLRLKHISKVEQALLRSGDSSGAQD